MVWTRQSGNLFEIVRADPTDRLTAATIGTRDLTRSRPYLRKDCQIEPNSPSQRNSLAICWLVQNLHENRFAE